MGLKHLRAVWIVVAVSLVAVSGFALLIASSDSTTVKFRDAGDSYVSTASPTTVYGYGTSFWVSKSGTDENWGLVSFSVSSMVGSTNVIVSARLKLVVTQASGRFPAMMNTGRLLADFSETTVTYNTIPAVATDAITATLFNKTPGPGKTVMIDVTQQLLLFRSSGQIGKFGLYFAMDPTTANSGIAFASRENTTLDYQPTLTVFTVPPGQYGYVPAQSTLVAARTDV